MKNHYKKAIGSIPNKENGVKIVVDKYINSLIILIKKKEMITESDINKYNKERTNKIIVLLGIYQNSRFISHRYYIY